MYCPKCGNNLPDTVKFCGKCGARIGNVNGSTNKKKKKQFLDRRFFGISILIVLGIILMIAVPLSRKGRVSEQEQVSLVEMPIEEAAKVPIVESAEEPVPEPLFPEEVFVGDIVEFGAYEQDNDLSNGNEPLEWIVVDSDNENGSVMLLSRYVIDTYPYAVLPDDDMDYFINSVLQWENSDIREWLNTEFYQNAFETDEQRYILSTELNNDDKEGTLQLGTIDNIFLLSVDEFGKYREINMVLDTNYTEYVGNKEYEEHIIDPDSLEDTVVFNDPDVWWLRTMERDCMVSMVGLVDDPMNDGDYEFSTLSCDQRYGVRPALWVSLTYEPMETEEKVTTDRNEEFATVISEAQVGDIIEMGLYEQNNIEGKEPIEWIVIDVQGEELLLLSRKILDVQVFNLTSTDCSWQNSYIRSWLNGEFLSQISYSCDAEEQYFKALRAHDIQSVHNDDGEVKNITTSDRIFLLSEEEAKYYLSGKEEWRGEVSELAIQKGLYANDTGSEWWLRSPTEYKVMTSLRITGHGETTPWNIKAYNENAEKNLRKASLWRWDLVPGNVSHYEKSDIMNERGVRPAMWITR